MIGVGLSLTRGGRTPRWTPAKLGNSLRFAARPPKAGAVDRVTLAGSSILTLANDGGSAGQMSAGAGYCTLDNSILQGGYQAIRTSAYTSDLRVLTGGPSGTTQVHMVALAATLTQPGAGQNNSDYMVSGDPGNAAGSPGQKNFGLGVTSASNGAWDLVGGFQNASQAGNSSFPNASFDTSIHLYEAIADGSQILLNRDGGKVMFFAGGTTTLSSGRMGFSGIYPLSSYGPPDTRVYWAAWFDRVLTPAERVLLLKYIASEYSFRPKRFFSATGDSITAGHVGAANTTSFLEQLKLQYAALGTPETITIFNQGISSQTTTQIAARSPSSFADAYSPLGANFRTQYLIINGGKNDNQATETPAQCYANLASISVAAQALGVTTVMTTAFLGTPSTRTAPTTAWVVALNALITANSCGATLVADYWVDNDLADPQVAHWPDNVHPDDFCLNSMATVLRNVIG